MMIKTNNKKLCFLFLITLLFSGCQKKENVPPNVGETNTAVISASSKDIHSTSFNERVTSVASDPANKESLLYEAYSTIPMYSMEDYYDVQMGLRTIANNGDLLVCLSMLATYYQEKDLNPQSFIKTYADYIDNNGKIDKKLIYKIAADSIYGVTVKKEPYDLAKACNYMHDGATILVRIKNPSVYSKTSTYLILIASNSNNGTLMVRDPNGNNIKKHRIDTTGNELWYSAAQICLAAGDRTIMYVYK